MQQASYQLLGILVVLVLIFTGVSASEWNRTNEQNGDLTTQKQTAEAVIAQLTEKYGALLKAYDEQKAALEAEKAARAAAETAQAQAKADAEAAHQARLVAEKSAAEAIAAKNSADASAELARAAQLKAEADEQLALEALAKANASEAALLDAKNRAETAAAAAEAARSKADAEILQLKAQIAALETERNTLDMRVKELEAENARYNSLLQPLGALISVMVKHPLEILVAGMATLLVGLGSATLLVYARWYMPAGQEQKQSKEPALKTNPHYDSRSEKENREREKLPQTGQDHTRRANNQPLKAHAYTDAHRRPARDEGTEDLRQLNK